MSYKHSEFCRLVAQHFLLAKEKTALEARLDQRELEQSDKYGQLIERLNQVKTKLEICLDEFEIEEFHELFQRL